MSNSNVYGRLWKLETKLNMMILDGKRDPQMVADALQKIIGESQKFALLAGLGIITVPEDYDHSTRLAEFRHNNYYKFYSYDHTITDANFGNPTRILKPGDKLWVRAFKQIVPGTTTSEERMAFLATQEAIHTGAQGLSLVFEQKRDQLPKGKSYVSFDEPDRLWQDAGGDYGVPSVYCHSDGDFNWSHGVFEVVWDDDSAFLCFCNLRPEFSGA